MHQPGPCLSCLKKLCAHLPTSDKRNLCRSETRRSEILGRHVLFYSQHTNERIEFSFINPKSLLFAAA